MKLLSPLAAALVAGGTVSLMLGVYLPAKATLAQHLLRRAWAKTGSDPVKPWPWANTWPVARLEVPNLGVDEIVLAGAEGAALAFGPGHVDGTGRPGGLGNVVIAGHRDTVFRFLGRLRAGDEVWLESRGQRRRRYVVQHAEVIHERETRVLAPTSDPTLTLLTCYPLDGDRPGGALRYVVRAVAGASGDFRQSPSEIDWNAQTPGNDFRPRSSGFGTLETSRHAAVGGTPCSSAIHPINQKLQAFWWTTASANPVSSTP